MKNILITGGAGFIGSSLIESLVKKNRFHITVLDNLSPQIHGINPEESYLYNKIKGHVNFIQASITDAKKVKQACAKQDIVIHLAAETGTGQSMYQIQNYAHVNANGTAILLESLDNPEKLIIASSRAVYGEGKYFSAQENKFYYPKFRDQKYLDKKIFNPVSNGNELEAALTDENSQLNASSIYAITKLAQEMMMLNIGYSKNIPTIALRFQNVYGPGQSLTNPYTGILSIFSNLLLHDKKINIFEDGLESRDFVYIKDVVQSIELAIEDKTQTHEVYNVGTSVGTTVLEIANQLKQKYNSSSVIEVSGNYRIGDIRHAKADITKIKRDLGFYPKVAFNEGIEKFANWVFTQKKMDLDYDKSIQELKAKGLLK